nr:unnamed protein product [Callosobruchus analis]
MSASAQFGSCEYYNQYGYNFYGDAQRVPGYGNAGYQYHNTYPFGGYAEKRDTFVEAFSDVKEEPSSCRFNAHANQGYSNPVCEPDDSISRRPVINQAYQPSGYGSLATSLSPPRAANEDDSTTESSSMEKSGKMEEDPSALRALLSKPGGEKITYDYTELKKTQPSADYEVQASNISLDCDEDLSSCGKEKTSERAEDSLTAAQSTFYPWMRSSNGN